MPRRYMTILIPVLILAALPAAAQDLDELLSQVGQPYAEAYTEPLINAFGANQNSAIYQTAQIGSTGP